MDTALVIIATVGSLAAVGVYLLKRAIRKREMAAIAEQQAANEAREKARIEASKKAALQEYCSLSLEELSRRDRAFLAAENAKLERWKIERLAGRESDKATERGELSKPRKLRRIVRLVDL